jgi:hypothetical protein
VRTLNLGRRPYCFIATPAEDKNKRPESYNAVALSVAVPNNFRPTTAGIRHPFSGRDWLANRSPDILHREDKAWEKSSNMLAVLSLVVTRFER